MSAGKTRNEIIKAADQLIYLNGYEHTSFATIANVVKISRGNFYYHFKTKDQILNAVIEQRKTNTRSMIRQWEQQHTKPAERIKCYIKIILQNWPKIKQHGCPVGTLCNEMTKLSHPSQKQARGIFTIFRKWLRDQFRLLGHEEQADQLAMHVLSWSQGVATMASTFKAQQFAENEVDQMCRWLDELTTGKSI